MKYEAQIKELKCENEVANTKHALEIAKLQKQLVEVSNRKNNLKRVLETTFEENDKYAEECTKQEQQIRDKEKRIVQLEQKIYDQDIASNENLLRIKIDLLAVSNEKKNLEESLAANISEKNQLELYIDEMEGRLDNLKEELDKTKCAIVDVKPKIIKSESFEYEAKYKKMILKLEEKINDVTIENMSCVSENVKLKNKIEYLQERLDKAMDLLAEQKTV